MLSTHIRYRASVSRKTKNWLMSSYKPYQASMSGKWNALCWYSYQWDPSGFFFSPSTCQGDTLLINSVVDGKKVSFAFSKTGKRERKKRPGYTRLQLQPNDCLKKERKKDPGIEQRKEGKEALCGRKRKLKDFLFLRYSLCWYFWWHGNQ